MTATVFKAGRVVTPWATLEGTAVRVVDGKIAAIGPAQTLAAPGDRVLEHPDCLLTPGLIDIHFHGGAGLHFHSSNPAELDTLMRTVASWGVTGATPSLGAMVPDDLAAAVVRLRALAGRQTGGARVLGIHLEGPYFNPQKKGAQNINAIRLPDRAEAERLLELAGGLLRLVTLAPEMEGADAVITLLKAAGVTVSVGHSDASWEEVQHAVGLGLNHSCHTGNAQGSVNHRVPGTFGAVLATDEITCELIGDSYHIHPAIMKVIWRAKGTDRTVLVSDATAAAGLPDGEYPQGHRTVYIKNGRATLADGTLAGSCSPLHRGVRNMVKLLGAPIHEAVRMASLNPARAIGCQAFTGSIEVGKDADLAIMDEDFRPQLTIVKGEVVFQA